MKKHRATPSCTLTTVFPGTFFSKRLGQLVIWAALLMVPFLTSAQSWDTVRIVDFSSYPPGGDINNIQGFTAQGFSLFYYGASGEEDDRCAFAQNFNAGDRIAMRVPLEAGKEYRISINAKTSIPIPTRTMDFIYAPGNNIQQVTTVSSGVALPHGIDANEPGSNVSSNIFSVPANGNYWVAIRHSSSTSAIETWARLDNFMVEAQEEAPMHSLSLADNDGNPITSSIEAEPGTPFTLCLSPDSAPAEDMALALSVDGDGSPHFSKS